MSLTEEKNSKLLNIEGILANFFLEKIEMESYSDNESIDKKRKKHKKHKSKKSKNKHKKSRSHSNEKNEESMIFSRHHSSSEEKDFQRLKRLKNSDTKEKPSSHPILNFSSVHASPEKDSKKITDSNNTPYGPSLETLFSIEHETCKNSFDLNINNILSNVNQSADDKEKTKFFCKAKGSEALLLEEKTNPGLLTDEKVNSVKQMSSNDDKVASKETFVNACTKDSIDKVYTDIPKSSNMQIKKNEHSRSRSSSANDMKDSKKKSNKSRNYKRSPSPSRHKSHKVRKRSLSQNRSKSRSYSPSRKSKRSCSKESRKKHRKHAEKRRNRSSSKTRHRSYSRSKSREPYSSRKRYRSRSRSYDYSPHSSNKDSRPRKRRDSSSDYDTKSRRRSRSKSRGRQRHSSRNHKIDQAKILELAQKNVLSMIENGTMPEGLSIENFKKEQFVSLKAGGKSVEELTAFCEKLSKRENEPLNEKDDTENANVDSDFIHHPFKIKETSTIKLNIKNAVQIPIKTHAEKVAETARLSSQFPVSSGNQHKQKELEWIPVEATSKTEKNSNDTKTLVPLTSIDTPTLPQENIKTETCALISQSESPAVSSVPLPPSDSVNPPLLPPPLPPVPPPLPPPLPPSGLMSTLSSMSAAPLQPEAIDYPINPINMSSLPLFCSYPIIPDANNFQQPQPFPCAISPVSANDATVLQSSSIFSTPSSFHSKKPVDVSTIVTQRFKALTKLQSDPNDMEALKTLEEAQTSIQDWVQSQQVPGLFTGSTGAKLLSVEELSGPRHWNYRAKKDLFIRAAPVTGGKGMSLLKKMGWNPGEGLGKNKEGSLEPLVLDIKTDKKGLVSEGEGSKKLVSSVLKDLQGKHPVSALMELCSKRKWKPPLYSLISESGPAHKKLFLFKVEVNNVEYHPVTPVNNKKVAKADAAVICLQALNIFPKA